MDGELVRLTGTEWAVLDCLWEASPQTMTQLAHTLAGREGWAKGTTTTVLKRMTEKGLLTCQQGERAKWYAPAVERRAAVVSETRSFLRRICHGKQAQAGRIRKFLFHAHAKLADQSVIISVLIKDNNRR